MSFTPAQVARARWALLGGNFAIACGVMAPSGALNDIARSMAVTVPVAGQMGTVGAVVLALGAPLLAAWVAGFDRRRLLVFWLVWFGLGHLASALMPNFVSLVLLRTLALLGAAVFTPQAGAAIGVMTPAASRSGAIAFVFLGWSFASVIGLPITAYVAETFGWRATFAFVGVLSLLAAAAVWRALPDGVRPPPMSAASWRSVFTHPLLMTVVAVTTLAGASQFTLYLYLAPYLRQVLGLTPAEMAAMFFWFGGIGLAASLVVTRQIDRLGPTRMVTVTLSLMACTYALWPLGGSGWLLALVMVPWALGGFGSQSSQHARLSALAPAWAPALMALNSAAIYVGQAIGAAVGGALIATSGYTLLSWAALIMVGIALAASLWAARRGSVQVAA
ncbi:MAG: MFS transporter [Burkholderiaceae bacterium]|nr:MFS transporter [Burkholderiaceae bacterium]